MSFRDFVKKFIPKDLFRHIEPFGHLCEAVFFNIVYGFPARNLKVIGVTGTNGKTSTSFMIYKLLRQAGHKTGLMTTVAYGVDDRITPQVAHMTTVSVPLLLKRIKQMKRRGMEWLVLETTSHALAQNRVWGIPFSVAVMTNLTHEHLDYHGSFEAYRAAKVKLFRMAGKNKNGLRTGVINGEDANARYFSRAVPSRVIYGLKKGDVQAKNIKLTSGGSRFVAKAGQHEYRIRCHLPGSFNVANALAAVSVGRVLGLDQDDIEQGIDALKGVEGRMETIDEGQDFTVVVDFAHTPDSFEKLFQDLKPVVKGRLIVLFGSAGRRDQAKRPIQGQLAGQYADEVIITEEDDRDIDGHQIMDEIATGAEKVGKVRDKDLFLILDRTEAIHFAMERATKGDTVLLLGKGHEKTIERADGEHPWDEITVAHKALKQL